MVLFLIGGGMLAAWLGRSLLDPIAWRCLRSAFGLHTAACSRSVVELVAPLQSWLARCFFGATVGFQVPVRDSI